MPYVQAKVDSAISSLGYVLDGTPLDKRWGLLNYIITQITGKALGAAYEANYNAFNSAIGALEAAKLELYRRAVAPYEDQKILENGDVPAYQGR